MIFCGIDRDYSEPATAHLIAHELGIASGQVRHALVCTGERSSSKTRYISDLYKDRTLGANDVQNTLGVFSLGDAGGAMALGPTDNGTSI